MEQVAEGIHRLGSRFHNFYVVVDQGAATVVDAGCSREWAALVDGLGRIDLEPGDVKGILLTHAHVDHIGFAAEASGHGLLVHTHPIEAQAARGERANPAAGPTDVPWWNPFVWMFFVTMLRAGAGKLTPVRNVVEVDDGETLDLPAAPRLVHTPGHTPGHAAFHFPAHKAVFTGDALVTMRVTGGPGGPQLMPPAFNADPAQATASLQRLRSLDAELLLPGHGAPHRGPINEAVAAAIN